MTRRDPRSRRQRRLSALLAVIVAFWSLPALAWGIGGHSVVAELAERQLAPETRRKIHEIMGDEGSLASWAGWADVVAISQPSTRPWHFVNIPYDATAYDPARDCPGPDGGDCVVGAIHRFRNILADPTVPREDRAEALRFLIHFVADAHQPLHCATRDNDNGGSTVTVTFNGQTMSLHGLWDYGLLDARSFDWGEHLREVLKLPLRQLEGPPDDDPASWVWQCHRLAVEVAYDLPADRIIDDKYTVRADTVIDRQLGLAGLRLARLLNAALR